MCTRIFWNDNAVARVVARTVDWEFDDEARLWALPRGLARTGDAGPGSATWTSELGSVSVSSWNVGAGEAVNEHGLAAHVLYLGAAQYEPPDDRPTINNVMWPQWVVDRFTTVAEALAGLAEVRVVPAVVHGQEMPLHLALEDPTGDSAIVEMLDGQPVVHHGREHRVMANDPSYDEQLASLARYRDFGGDLPMPGDIVSADRFVRASYFLRHLPPPATREEAVAGVISLGRNVSIPFGAPDNRFDTYPTWWLSATDLTNRVFFFQSTRTPNVVWLELDSLELGAGAEVRSVDPLDVTLVGNVAEQMEVAELPFGV
jgi:penicillin V acylase-like amidase (Ntn superfamily)